MPIRIAVVGLSAILLASATLLACEVWFRLMSPCRLSGVVYDEQLGWRLKRSHEAEVTLPWADGPHPLVLRFNRDGFQDTDHARGKAPGRKRILVLGDSYTAGLDTPVDLIFTTRFAHLLNQTSRSGPAYEVMNVSVPAWATDQQYLYLREEGLAYHPDYVLLLVAPNDIREAYGKRFFTLVNGHLEQRGPSAIPGHARLTWFLSNRSCAFQALQSRLGLTYGTPRNFFKYFPVHFPVGSGRSNDSHLFLKDSPPEIAAALGLFKALVLEMHQLCQRHQCRLLTAIIPTKMEFDGALRAQPYQPGKIAEFVGALAEGHDIPFLDLFSILASSRHDPLAMFIPQEYHLNERGHAFVAETLLPFFIRHR